MDYRTGYAEWRAGALPRGLSLAAGGREVEVAVEETGFAAFEAIPSWNASTPAGAWIAIESRARLGRGWTPWFPHGTWSTASAEHPAASVEDTALPGLGRVATDTLVLEEAARGFALRLSLHPSPSGEAPELRSLSLSWSEAKPKTAPPSSSPRSGPLRVEGLPAWSQMLYPDGGRAWCSPTSLSMILAHWILRSGSPLPEEEAFVRENVSGVYDRVYEGHGNWSFNMAWAGERGFFARARRFPGLDALEPFLARGMPLALSVSWDEEKGRPLPGAPVANSKGHLTTLLGFDDRGDALMHEPAARDDASVPRTYPRAELEARWLEASGGLAYLVEPD